MPTFSDQIVDDSGYRRPVGGAMVYLLDDDGNLVAATSPNPVVTDDLGAFSFTAPDGSYYFEGRIGGVTIARGSAIVGNPPQYIGPPGTSNNTRLTLAILKAANVADQTSLYDGSLWTWTLGNFTGQADDTNIVKADSTALSVGAWVRQRADGVNFDGRAVGAKLAETVSITDARFAGGASATKPDNTTAIQAAIDEIFAAGGGTVEVPVGKFDYVGPLYQKERVRIVGKGFGSRLHSTNTTRANGIIAQGPTSGARIRGVSIENLRITSSFDAIRDGTGTVTGNNGILTGNAIRWLRVSQSFINNVWTHNWQDSGISLTDCDNVHGNTVDIAVCSQGYDIFNDSWNCTFNGLTMRDLIVYVGLNIEGLAGGSSKRPYDCGGSNVFVDGATTHGINILNCDRCYITGWNVTNSRGSAEGPGDGLQAYGCTNANFGIGTAANNAGRGLDLGPTMNDAKADGILTMNNALGGCRITDGGGIGTSFRVSLGFSRFMEGPVQFAGNASVLNVVQGLTLEAPLPMLNLSATSTTKRNAQIAFKSGVDADMFRFGPDITTNNGTNIFQLFLDSYAEQIFGVNTGSISGAVDNTQSLGRPDRRFSTVYAGTGAINTSDATTKQQISDIPDEWLDAWADVDWLRFKFNDAVAEKGDAARWHIGVIAQRVRDAFLARGLDATDIGLLCYDEWEAVDGRPAVLGPEGDVQVPAVAAKPAGSLWSVRMGECQAMEAAWLRREIARLRSL